MLNSVWLVRLCIGMVPRQPTDTDDSIATVTDSDESHRYVDAVRTNRRLIVPKHIRDHLDGRCVVSLRKVPGAMPTDAPPDRRFRTFVTRVTGDPRIVIPTDIVREAGLERNDRVEVYIKPFRTTRVIAEATY